LIFLIAGPLRRRRGFADAYTSCKATRCARGQRVKGYSSGGLDYRACLGIARSSGLPAPHLLIHRKKTSDRFGASRERSVSNRSWPVGNCRVIRQHRDRTFRNVLAAQWRSLRRGEGTLRSDPFQAEAEAQGSPPVIC
jgi:hypothetical protein